MVRAWVVGVCVVLTPLLIWAVLLELEIFSPTMAIILWLSPGVAALAASYLAPSRKFLLGASMGVPAALLAVAFNVAWQLQGIAVDFPGLDGSGILFMLTFVYASVVASVGALVGYFLTKKAA